MKKFVIAFVATASLFSAFSFTHASKTAASESLGVKWYRITDVISCVTNDGQAGTLSGCQTSYSNQRCPGIPTVPECLPNG